MGLSLMEFLFDLNKEYEKSAVAKIKAKSARGWYMTLAALSRGLATMPLPPGPLKLAEYELNPRAIAASTDLVRINIALAMHWVF